MIDSIFIEITVVSQKFLSVIIKHVKIFQLKFSKIKFNIVLQTIIYDICVCILIKLVYCILVENVIVNCFNFILLLKKIFKLTLRLYKSIFEILKVFAINGNC